MDGGERRGCVVRRMDSRGMEGKEMEEFQFRFKSNTVTASVSSAFNKLVPTCFCFSSGPFCFCLPLIFKAKESAARDRFCNHLCEFKQNKMKLILSHLNSGTVLTFKIINVLIYRI